MKDPIVEVRGVNKVYRLYATPLDRLKEALNPFGKAYHRDFYALKDVSLKVYPGECVGIIGMNGSGKSTVLQIIAGVLTPNQGTVRVAGTISALLELGAGFNGEFTGVENVYFQFSIMGIPHSKNEELLSKILEFADIGEFAYQPVKTYSSGMYVRLAFAVAINVDPDILIVDEALSVGDAYFQAKCMKKIREFRASGKTLLFVSHDPGSVKSLCDRAYLLHKGEVLDEGSPEQVFNCYNSLISMKEHGDDITSAAKMLTEAMKKRSGNKKIEISNVSIFNEANIKTESITSGEMVTIELELQTYEEVENPTIGILIRDRLGNDIFGINSHFMGINTGLFRKGTAKKAHYQIKLDLGPNIYTLTVAIHSDETHINENYDWINEAIVFRVLPSPDFKFAGYCRLKPHFALGEGSRAASILG